MTITNENVLVACIEESEMSLSDSRRCSELDRLVWPEAATKVFPKSSPSAPFEALPQQRGRTFVVRTGDDGIVAKASFKPRQVRVGDDQLVVLALAGVLCHPSHRGKGFGRLVVEKCFELVDRGDFLCSIFQTEVPEFYKNLGARLLENQIVNSLGDPPGVRPFWDTHAVIYPAAFEISSAAIDTLGPGW